MAAYNKFQCFVGHLGLKIHDLNLDTLKVMLVNSPAPVATNTVKADLTEITAANGYPAGGSDTTNLYSQTSGTGSLTCTDVVWTAAGGSFGPGRYVVMYNDTPIAAPIDPLIGWWDYGSSVTVNTGETFTVDFGATTLTIA